MTEKLTISSYKELYNAINIIIICWNSISPKSPLLKIKGNVEKNYFNEPLLSEIKAINTIISHDIKGRTVQGMLSDLKKQNDIKNYDFLLLNNLLNNYDITSHFG